MHESGEGRVSNHQRCKTGEGNGSKLGWGRKQNEQTERAIRPPPHITDPLERESLKRSTGKYRRQHQERPRGGREGERVENEKEKAGRTSSFAGEGVNVI